MKPLTRLIHLETGMRVDEFADMLGTSRRKVDRVDAIHTSIGFLRDIAKHLNLTIDELVDVLESENMSSSQVSEESDEIQQENGVQPTHRNTRNDK